MVSRVLPMTELDFSVLAAHRQRTALWPTPRIGLTSSLTHTWRLICTSKVLELAQDVQPRCGQMQHCTCLAGLLYFTGVSRFETWHMWSTCITRKECYGYLAQAPSLNRPKNESQACPCRGCDGQSEQLMLWHPKEICFNVPEQSSVSISSSSCWQCLSYSSAITVFSCTCFLKVWLLDKNFDEFYSKVEQWRRWVVGDNVITQIKIRPEQWG